MNLHNANKSSRASVKETPKEFYLNTNLNKKTKKFIPVFL